MSFVLVPPGVSHASKAAFALPDCAAETLKLSVEELRAQPAELSGPLSTCEQHQRTNLLTLFFTWRELLVNDIWTHTTNLYLFALSRPYLVTFLLWSCLRGHRVLGVSVQVLACEQHIPPSWAAFPAAPLSIPVSPVLFREGNTWKLQKLLMPEAGPVVLIEFLRASFSFGKISNFFFLWCNVHVKLGSTFYLFVLNECVSERERKSEGEGKEGRRDGKGGEGKRTGSTQLSFLLVFGARIQTKASHK